MAATIASLLSQAAAEAGVVGEGDGGGPAEDMVQEAPEASEEARDAADGGDRDDRAEARPDEDGEPREEPAPKAEPASKWINKMARKERELSEARSRIRDLERTVEEARQSVPDLSSGDRLDVVRQVLARRLGAKDASDPRIKDELQELMSDLLFEAVDESAMSGQELEAFRRRKEEAQRARKDQEWRRSLEDRVARAEREKMELQRAQMQQQAVAHVASYLRQNETKFGFLMAQGDVDPAEAVAIAALEAIRTGQVQVRDEADEAALLARVAGNLDAHYRGLAERLAPKLTPRGPTSPQANGGTTKRGPAKAAGGRPSVAASGGGGRGRADVAPPESADDDGDGWDLHSLISRGMQRELRARKGR